MRTIVIGNNKGGVGKTTTAVNMAAALRNNGYDVLLIDYDGQANATYCYGLEPDNATYKALKTKEPQYIQPVRIKTPEAGKYGVLDILPSCNDMSALEIELGNQPDRLTRFSGFVDLYKKQYDVIIIDTPPTIGILTITALMAADEIIIPLQPHALAVKGLVSLRSLIDNINLNKPKPVKISVLITAYERRSLHKAISEQVAAVGFNTYQTKIRSNITLAETPLAGKSIFDYAPNSNGAKDYNGFVEEYLSENRIKHTNHRYK